jgi:hypothetical protein
MLNALVNFPATRYHRSMNNEAMKWAKGIGLSLVALAGLVTLEWLVAEKVPEWARSESERPRDSGSSWPRR